VGTPTIVKNTVYVVSGDGVLYAFNTTDGRVSWSYTAGTGLGSLLPVNGYLYVGSSSGVYCFNANNAEIIWNFAAGDFAASSPTFPTYADGVIYVGCNGPMFFSHVTQHNFYALNASNGEQLWNCALGYTVASSPLVENGAVYISGNFVSSESPDSESSGVVLALKPSLTSLPLQSPLPTPTPSVPEFPEWVALPIAAAVTLVAFIIKKKKKAKT
jgi:outer membrane protein assembly factor BamB